MKFIKKNKFTILIIVAFIVLVIIAAFVKNIFFINSGQPVYGNRLDGIEEVKIEDSTYEEIASTLKKDKIVTNVTSDLSGKIINVIITVINDTSIKDAKKIGDKVLEFFDEKQLSFYDIQIFIKKDDSKQNDFPIIGYKHHAKKGLSWSKDRKVTSSED